MHLCNAHNALCHAHESEYNSCRSDGNFGTAEFWRPVQFQPHHSCVPQPMGRHLDLPVIQHRMMSCSARQDIQNVSCRLLAGTRPWPQPPWNNKRSRPRHTQSQSTAPSRASNTSQFFCLQCLLVSIYTLSDQSTGCQQLLAHPQCVTLVAAQQSHAQLCTHTNHYPSAPLAAQLPHL
jgi:hypothetical protein